VFRQHVIVEFSSLRGKMDKEDAGRRHGSTVWGLIDAPFFSRVHQSRRFLQECTLSVIIRGYKLFL
jgi:hypothetical protein